MHRPRVLESRHGTLQTPDRADVRAAAEAASVRRSARVHHECMRRSGYPIAFAVNPEGATRRQFEQSGLLIADGVPNTEVDPEEIRAALRFELKIAHADHACRQISGVDRAIDRALRSRLEPR